MAWRLANSLETLRGQVNAAAPNRSKASDGTIGDVAHSARTSDHNPNADGVVCALDLTHDPAHGVDAGLLANALIGSRDPRIKYVIWNRRIASSTTKPWTWRPYTGSNPHTKHVHVSVLGMRDLYDSREPWDIGALPAPQEAAAERAESLPVLRQGMKGVDVQRLQALLNAHGSGLTVDGDFGPRTRAAVVNFQRHARLVADGIVGPYTWGKLEETS